MYKFVSYLALSLFAFQTIAADSINACFNSTRSCVAVVDAGSSGSRLHLYAFNRDSKNMPVDIEEILNQKNSGGLATISLDKLDTYLEKLVKTTATPSENKIPLYFFSTAGMRLLPPDTQKQYYHSIQSWFNNPKNSSTIPWDLKEIKTITGIDEGIYGWLSINYQLNRLSSEKEFAGFIEVGGASAQVVTAVAENYANVDTHLTKLDFYGQPITLFAHSALGLGQDAIMNKFTSTPECFVQDFAMENDLVGQGDAQLCTRHAIKSLEEHNLNTLVGPVIKSNYATDWYATGGIAYTASDKDTYNFSEFTSNQFLGASNTLCKTSWSDLSQNNSNPFLSRYCLYPSYYYALIVEGFGLDADQNITVIPKEMKDWSMGVILYPGESKL